MDNIQSFGKINLSLRIVGRRADGYHELISTFLRIGPLENLTIDASKCHNVRDDIQVTGARIQGPNILALALNAVRNAGCSVPALKLQLSKTIPPGTGLGCGSGNAAALLSWLQQHGYNTTMDIASLVGADVPFFLGTHRLALVSGVGEFCSPLHFKRPFRVLLAIPKWRCATPATFKALDSYYTDIWPESSQVACEEVMSLLSRLDRGQKIGLLPNDFVPVLIKYHPEYQELFAYFNDRGALSWGISGSGSTAFCLLSDEDSDKVIPNYPWIEQILSLKA